MDRVTPHSFWRHAKSFLLAAEAVKPTSVSSRDQFISKPSMVAYYLLGHSIELSLKSYLFAKGYPTTVLRDRKRFGHNLSALLIECRKRKLGREVKLTSREIGAIDLLSNDYRTKRFEYLEYGAYRVPDYFFLYVVARKFVNGLASYAMRSTHK